VKADGSAHLVIRDAVPSDVEAMMVIRLAVVENAISPARLEALGINESSLRVRLSSTFSGHCAEIGGRVIGFAMADLERGSVWALFVLPEAEGRGAGRRLLEAALRRIWGRGHARAVLSTDPGTRASVFYRRSGWRVIGSNERGETVFALDRPPFDDRRCARGGRLSEAGRRRRVDE
jgi:GNAT superfamily N-acetyltransferase